MDAVKQSQSYVVYVLLFPTNKTYVGITSRSPTARWGRGYGYKNQPVFEDVQAYGWDSVERFILANSLTRNEAEVLEKEAISVLDSCNPENGYNKQTGGFSGYHIIEETKEKMRISCSGWKQTTEAKKRISESKKGLPRKSGWHHSEETRQKIGESNRGKKRSAEVCARLSEQRRGRTHRGATMTPEWREKISKGRREYFRKLKERDT